MLYYKTKYVSAVFTADDLPELWIVVALLNTLQRAEQWFCLIECKMTKNPLSKWQVVSQYTRL